MRFWIRGMSSILAIAGGAMFLVLPVEFLNGTVSIAYPNFYLCLAGLDQSSNYYLSCAPPPPIRPMSDYMAVLLILLGTVAVLLGCLGLKVGPRPRSSIVLGLVFSLGSMAFLFWVAISQILETFVTDPAYFVLFPELSIPVMTAAIVVFIYELLQARSLFLSARPETNARQSRTRYVSSILAIAGGVLFLRLPVALLNGTASISDSPWCSYTLPNYCFLPVFHPITIPGELVPVWLSLGVIGLFPGILSLKLSLKPRGVAALGLVVSLGSVAVMFLIATVYVLETLIITPGFLPLLVASFVAMAVATVLVIFELMWQRAPFAHRSSSLLAVLAGLIFLVLPVAFLNGSVLIDYPTAALRCPYGGLCPLLPFSPEPAGIVSFWVFLGAISVLLGFFPVILGPRPRVGFALGLAFSLGSMALLLGKVTLQILETFIVTPSSFLLFPMVGVVAILDATVLFSVDLALRGREVIEAVPS